MAAKKRKPYDWRKALVAEGWTQHPRNSDFICSPSENVSVRGSDDFVAAAHGMVDIVRPEKPSPSVVRRILDCERQFTEVQTYRVTIECKVQMQTAVGHILEPRAHSICVAVEAVGAAGAALLVEKALQLLADGDVITRSMLRMPDSRS